MGKGDRKTKKGKINKGSYGVRRPKSSNKATITPAKKKATKAKPKAKAKKAAPAKPKAKAKKAEEAPAE